MPMNFPDLTAMMIAARFYGFRDIDTGESESDYRLTLAEFVERRDRIEGHEIRTGKGCDKWDDDDKLSFIARSLP